MSLSSTKQQYSGQLLPAGGEVAAAVADVSLLERELTPALVRRHLQAIRNAPVLLVDGNLQPPAIAVQPLPILATLQMAAV